MANKWEFVKVREGETKFRLKTTKWAPHFGQKRRSGRVLCTVTVTPGDALLVRDLNGNGLIDNGSELFGTSTQDGFAVLRTLDSNGDGLITSADAVWGSLQVWRDLNQDGVSQAGELAALSTTGIVSINLNATASDKTRAGNSILFTSSTSLSTGTTAEVIAVAFVTDQINTTYVLPVGLAYDAEVFGLPNLRGYGTLPDLWVARNDNELDVMIAIAA
jgi:hypothetical protein